MLLLFTKHSSTGDHELIVLQEVQSKHTNNYYARQNKEPKERRQDPVIEWHVHVYVCVLKEKEHLKGVRKTPRTCNLPNSKTLRSLKAFVMLQYASGGLARHGIGIWSQPPPEHNDTVRSKGHTIIRFFYLKQ